MFNTMLSKHKRFLFYYQRDQLLSPDQLFNRNDYINEGLDSSGEESQDFTHSDIETQLNEIYDSKNT